MSTQTSGRSAFDGIAGHYDARFSRQPIARHLRTEVMRYVLSLLPSAGGRVLEIGCGTGDDARTLAAQGHTVLATDAAPQMLRRARDKAGVPAAFDTAHWRVGDPIPEAVRKAAPYDMVFSNFGAVNCFGDLSAFGRDCQHLLAPGGYLVLVLINRWCLMEMLLGALRLDRRSATRRFRKNQTTRLEDGTALRVQFPSGRALSRELGAAFVMMARRPVGVFLPPSEYYGSFQKRPRLLRLATRLDRHPGRIWPFSRLGDHVLIEFRHLATT